MTHHMFNKRFALVLLFVLMFILTPSYQLSAYPDISGPDLVIDAPWRTTRDYLPVLFFVPEFDGPVELKLNALRLYNYDPSTTQRQLIFVDNRDTEDDQFDCDISFIGPEGEARSHLTEAEVVDSFWHYIARVPVSCITRFQTTRGTPGEYYLRGEIDWSHPLPAGGTSFGDIDETAFHVLRVIITPEGFAKFSPVDHQFDVHVHTIAEQTKWHGALNPDAGKKAYGGPLAMLMESAYALGMVDVQLRDGNWSDYRNKIITTDHNSFFSGPPYDAGTAPGYGPTSHHHTNGKEREFQWYRDHLGDLGGEEVTLQGANGNPLEVIDIDVDWDGVDVDTENVLALGSHFLSYGAEHFEGPWHGGGFALLPGNPFGAPMPGGPIGAPNDISITDAISKMGASNGFGYASHPESPNIGWSEDYYERAIGLYPHNVGSADSPILQKNQREFVFKGLQVWNGHADMRSRENGSIDYDEGHGFDPHTKSSRDQQFVPNPEWRNGHDKTYEAYKRLLRRGLDYSFDLFDADGKFIEASDHIFIRKLYLSAGTDSHAAFNDDISIVAAHLGELASDYYLDIFTDIGVSADNNAFGRLRTYTLTSQRYIRAGESIPRDCEAYPFCDAVPTAPSYYPMEDYKEGNTVATDGPVGRFSTDANCRFNSDIDKLTWHDDRCVWENHDGMIGGRGTFDGGNTMLAPVGNRGVMMRYDWIGKNDHRPDSESANGTMTFNLVKINPPDPNFSVLDWFNSNYSYEDNGKFKPGRSGGSNSAHINEILTDPYFLEFPQKSALILEGELSRSSDEVLNDPTLSWFPEETRRADGEEDGKVVDPYMTKFVTNPIWIAPYKISVDPVTTCPIEPGQLKVTVEFGISMDTTLPTENPAANLVVPAQMMEQISGQNFAIEAQRGNARSSVTSQFDTEAHSLPDKAVADVKVYDGIRVVIKPLDQRGNSTDVQYEISDQNSRWQAVEIPAESQPHLIADAKYTTTNTMAIPCGAGWNSENPKQKLDLKFASYAVVVDQIYDMHMNYLNPIAKTISMARPSSPYDKDYIEILDNNVLGLEEKVCSTRNKIMCGDFGADCEVVESAIGADMDVCRWPTANSADQCERTGGIWTPAQSKYARNHPGVVAAGATGACITNVQNLEDRIK